MLAVGRYSVGSEQSEEAKARIAVHEAWVRSDQRVLALAEVLMTRAIIDVRLREEVARQLVNNEGGRHKGDNDNEDEDEDDGKGEKRARVQKINRKTLGLAA